MGFVPIILLRLGLNTSKTNYAKSVGLELLQGDFEHSGLQPDIVSLQLG